MSAPTTAAASAAANKPKTPQASAPKAAPKRTRPVFQSPFGNLLGASLSESDTAAMLAICKAHFAAARATLTRFRTDGSASAGKRRRADIEQVVDEGDTELFRHADVSTALQGLVLGLNAVTRAMESGQLDAVLLCTNVTPPLLISHFPFLSHARQVPLIKLDCTTNALGATIGLNTAVCIGIRKTSFVDLIAELRPYGIVISVPWLPAQVSTACVELLPAVIVDVDNAPKPAKRLAKQQKLNRVRKQKLGQARKQAGAKQSQQNKGVVNAHKTAGQ